MIFASCLLGFSLLVQSLGGHHVQISIPDQMQREMSNLTPQYWQPAGSYASGESTSVSATGQAKAVDVDAILVGATARLNQIRGHLDGAMDDNDENIEAVSPAAVSGNCSAANDKQNKLELAALAATAGDTENLEIVSRGERMGAVAAGGQNIINIAQNADLASYFRGSIVGLMKVFEKIKAEIVNHPYRTAFIIGNLVITPTLGVGWFVAPVLRAIGFGTLGPVAGSLAAWYQSTAFGAYIPPGSLFSLLQRLGMVA